MTPLTPVALDEHCYCIYLEVPGSQVVNLQGTIEAYEGVGTVRTLDIKRSLVCILTTPSMLDDCIKILEACRGLVSWRPAQPPEGERDEYLGYQRKMKKDCKE